MLFPLLASYRKLLFTLLILGIIPAHLRAQGSDIYFSALGSSNYQEKITQLEKYVVPKHYSEKSSQAWYEEILTDRNKNLLYLFKEDGLVYDTLLLSKCNSIFNKIAAANKSFKFDTIRLYINRSMVANAACFGEGTIMVNLGLFLWVDNDDELALVIAHEIAHQLLNHFESKVEKSIAMLTSDEFKQELKDIKKADYGKYERFRKLMKGLTVESGRHSTYKESEADSLGVVLIKNAGFNIMNASKVLLKLDKVDDLFTSSLNVTMNADKDFDSIKTHPDCIRRYEAIAGKNNPATINCCIDLNNLNGRYKENAMLEIVRHLYETNSIGLCAHVSIFALKNNYNPAIYNYFLSLCFSRLYYNDKHLERFNAVNANAGRGTNLKELQDFLFDVSTADLETLSAWFLNYKVNAGSEDFEFANLMYNTQVKMKDTATAYNDFNNKFPKSKYQYLIQKNQK
jgi:predicted SprT family Zn-dependent metalloprotease